MSGAAEPALSVPGEVIAVAVRELRPGAFQRLFTPYPAAANAAAAATLDALGAACENKAKENLGKQSHAYGTPTPAHRGGPPAMISGALRDSVGRTKPRLWPTGFEVSVGVARRATPWYSKTPTSEYGRYLEDGDYPWLRPAFLDVARSGAGKVAQQMMRRYWRASRAG